MSQRGCKNAPLRNMIFNQNRVGVFATFRLRVCSVHRKRHCLKSRKAMCPNSFPVSKVDHLSPRKKWPILALFFSINFMLCDVLLPKIQPLSKTGNPDTATTLLWIKLLHFMLGGRGQFSTTFCWLQVSFAGCRSHRKIHALCFSGSQSSEEPQSE